MHLALSTVFTFALSASALADGEPKGRIGVQLKVENGKIVVVDAQADGPQTRRASRPMTRS